MKLILLQDVEHLGEQGQIVTVRDGYGRNFLIPRGLARQATAGVIRAQEEETRQASRKIAAAKDSAQALAQRLANMEVVITARTGDEDRLFGSVTPQQVAAQLAEEGVEVDRRRIDLGQDIRKTGVYTATVKLHQDVQAQVRVRVVPEGGAAVPAESDAE